MTTKIVFSTFVLLASSLTYAGTIHCSDTQGTVEVTATTNSGIGAGIASPLAIKAPGKSFSVKHLDIVQYKNYNGELFVLGLNSDQDIEAVKIMANESENEYVYSGQLTIQFKNDKGQFVKLNKSVTCTLD